MPIGTPFHSRTSALCTGRNWRTWSGYLVASSYDVVHDYEYHAIRNSAALIDVSPLFKYDVRGRDALSLVNRVITRDAGKCAIGQAIYTCLCDNHGKVIQDGTVFRLAEDHFRFHLAEPSLRWLYLNAVNLEVKIDDVSEQIAALALQGPNSLRILQQVTDAVLGKLRFFRLLTAKLGATPAFVSSRSGNRPVRYATASAPSRWVSPSRSTRRISASSAAMALRAFAGFVPMPTWNGPG